MLAHTIHNSYFTYSIKESLKESELATLELLMWVYHRKSRSITKENNFD